MDVHAVPDPLIENEGRASRAAAARLRYVAASGTPGGDCGVAPLSPMFLKLLRSRAVILEAVIGLATREQFAVETFGKCFSFPMSRAVQGSVANTIDRSPSRAGQDGDPHSQQYRKATLSSFMRSIASVSADAMFVDSPSKATSSRKREPLVTAVRAPLLTSSPKFRDTEAERRRLLDISLSCTFSGFIYLRSPPTTITTSAASDRNVKMVDTAHCPAVPLPQATDGEYQGHERQERQLLKRLDRLKAMHSTDARSVLVQNGTCSIAEDQRMEKNEANVESSFRSSSDDPPGQMRAVDIASVELLSLLFSLQIVTTELVQVYLQCISNSRRGQSEDVYHNYIHSGLRTDVHEALALCPTLRLALPMQLDGNIFVSQNFFSVGPSEGVDLDLEANEASDARRCCDQVLLGRPSQRLRFPVKSVISLEQEAALYRELGFTVNVCC